MGAKDRLRDLMALRVERSVARTTPGVASAPSDLRDVVRAEVTNALEHREHTTAAARRAASRFSTSRDATGARGLSPAPTAESAPSRAGATHGAAEGGVGQPARRPALQSPLPPPRLCHAPTPLVPTWIDEPQPDLWATIARQAYSDECEYTTAQRLARVEKMRQQCQILDEQVALRRRAKQQRPLEQQRERENADHLREVWEAQRRTAQAAHREVAERLRVERERQVEAQRQRRLVEDAERKRADAAILERIAAEKRAEEERTRAAREREVRMKEELIAANEAQKKIRAEHDAREAALEAACVAEMEHRLEQQARARQRSWEALKEKMKGREALALERQATLDDKAVQDELRAAAVTEARERARDERDRAQEQVQRAAARKIYELQCAQIAERQCAVEREDAAKRAEREEAERLVQESQRVAEARRRAAKEKKAAQRRMLEDQMRENAHFHEVVISEEEKRLNREILERAEGGPDGSSSRSRRRHGFSPI